MIFNPGDYIKTKDGQRGYVIERIDQHTEIEKAVYGIRLIHDYDFRKHDELELDPLMGRDES